MRLFVSLIVATAIAFAGVACVHCPTAARVSPTLSAREISIDPNGPVAREAWQTALAMAGAPQTFLPPSDIVRINMRHPENWGEYYWYLEVDGTGHAAVKEQIILYIPVDAPSPLLRNVLIHEFLHAIFLRRCFVTGETPDRETSELYVCALGACAEPRLVPLEAPHALSK